MGSLYANAAAEMEANDIGRRFMSSTDVLGAMGNAFGKNFKSKLRIHHDENADSKVKSVNRDALTEGNDIYFGKGILESNTPESRGLLAHEVSHTMQQSGDSGVSQSASFGASQGGLLRWLYGSRKYGKEKPQPTTALSKGANSLNLHYDNSISSGFEKFLSVPKLAVNGLPIDSKKGLLLRGLSSSILGSAFLSIKKRNAGFLKRSWLYKLASAPARLLFGTGKALFNLGRLGIGMFGKRLHKYDDTRSGEKKREKYNNWINKSARGLLGVPGRFLRATAGVIGSAGMGAALVGGLAASGGLAAMGGAAATPAIMGALGTATGALGAAGLGSVAAGGALATAAGSWGAGILQDKLERKNASKFHYNSPYLKGEQDDTNLLYSDHSFVGEEEEEENNDLNLSA